jgi:hypothetical protein
VRAQEARATLLPEAVGLAADGEDVAVVEQAVEDRGGDDGVAEDVAPFADAPAMVVS